MAGQIMFLDCPALLAGEGSARCGLPAEVRYRFVMNSTDGPLESAMIRCPSGHFFNGPVDCLSFGKQASSTVQQPGSRHAARADDPAVRRAARRCPGAGKPGAAPPPG